jgi:transcriptional antiterminator RfaH
MELWARSNLWERGLEVYLPQHLKLRRHARRRDHVARPLFPGYLFVHTDLELRGRRAVNSAPGVSYMVSFGGYTPSVPDEVIAEIRSREGEDGLVHLDDLCFFRPGEQLRVCDGAFADAIGLFAGVSDEHRVILLLDLLGRKVRVRMPAEHVSREL